MTWLKLLHISTLLVWCATLFYLPGLFSLHPRTRDKIAFRRLRIMTRFTYVAIASPAAILAIVSGAALIYVADAFAGWLAAKLAVVGLMVAYHVHCGHTLGRLWREPAYRAPAMHLASAAIPALLVSAVLWLVLAQPF